MEVIIILLSIFTVVLFTMESINNKLLNDIKEKLTEKKPEVRIDPIEHSDDWFNAIREQANKYKPLKHLGVWENSFIDKVEVGDKVIAMKGIHIGEIYTIERIDLRLYEAILKPYKLPEGGNYMETLRIHLDDLENEFEPLEDEE